MMGELERTLAEELAQRMQVDIDHDLRAAVVAALDLLDGGLDRSAAEATAPVG
jgi:Arc/MetJ family transcription regulator